MHYEIHVKLNLNFLSLNKRTNVNIIGYKMNQQEHLHTIEEIYINILLYKVETFFSCEGSR